MDKVKHLIAGILLSFTGLIVTSHAILAGVIAGLFWGCAKEVVDTFGLFHQKRTGWGWEDIAWTVIGGVIGGLIMALTGLGEYLKDTEYLFG